MKIKRKPAAASTRCNSVEPPPPKVDVQLEKEHNRRAAAKLCRTILRSQERTRARQEQQHEEEPKDAA